MLCTKYISFWSERGNPRTENSHYRFSHRYRYRQGEYVVERTNAAAADMNRR